jgi:hypothetical protein
LNSQVMLRPRHPLAIIDQFEMFAEALDFNIHHQLGKEFVYAVQPSRMKVDR